MKVASYSLEAENELPTSEPRPPADIVKKNMLLFGYLIHMKVYKIYLHFKMLHFMVTHSSYFLIMTQQTINKLEIKI